MFSRACKYGIRALAVIATASREGRKIAIKEVCKSSNTPESFTAKILQDLVKRDILDSQRGPSGGFYFSRDISKITLYEIVNAIDGDGVFYQCGLGLPACDAKNPCVVHTSFEIVRNQLNVMCKSNSLSDLITSERQII